MFSRKNKKTNSEFLWFFSGSKLVSLFICFCFIETIRLIKKDQNSVFVKTCDEQFNYLFEFRLHLIKNWYLMNTKIVLFFLPWDNIGLRYDYQELKIICQLLFIVSFLNDLYHYFVCKCYELQFENCICDIVLEWN